MSLLSYDPTTWWGIGLLVAFYVFGFLHILHALMNTRTSQGTIAWIACLISVPFFAIPLYWMLGRSRFTGYIRARRSNDIQLKNIIDGMHKTLLQYSVDLPEEDVIERAATELGGLPFTRGNSLQVLINGKSTFEHLFSAIARAEKYICVNFFIVKTDKVGMKFQKALIERARSGVKVYFLFDEIGSHKLTSTYLGELRDAGVQCEAFGSGRRLLSRLQMNFRNHRKIAVVDGREAFLGGLNVGDEYLGRDKRFGDWRDTHLHLKGPSVQAVQLVFLEDWFWACDRVPELLWETETFPADQKTAIIPTGPADPTDSWKLLVAEAANSSRKRLWITSPYFVPDDGVMTALQLAALRGVDVRIMLPAVADHLLVWLSSFAYYEQSIPFGVKLFRYADGFLHQKVLLIDDRMAAVGTANLDNRSFRLNFEVTAFVSDQTFIRQISDMLSEDFSRCAEVKLEEFTEKSFLFRAACRAARLMAPIQ
ncbi:cardiolipin synthase [Luteolibacter sp. AS25]|uniref:cardiolipin synthase n=1 Tax=Luteolibacter sp. AS25 TaxID=3135776 RepID=UPI00398B75EE